MKDEAIIQDIQDHLRPGEEIQFLIRPVMGWWVLAWALRGLSIIWIGFLITPLIGLLIIPLVVLLGSGYGLLSWYFVGYAVTDRRLVARSGILSASVKEAPFSQITDSYLLRHFRFFDVGTLGFNTPGGRSQRTVGQYEVLFRVIPDPVGTRRRILELRNQGAVAQAAEDQELMRQQLQGTKVDSQAGSDPVQGGPVP